jgi:hypothetical protein
MTHPSASLPRRSRASVASVVALAVAGWLAAPQPGLAACPAGQEEDEQGLCKPKAGTKPKPTATPKPTVVPTKPTSAPPPQPTATEPPRATCESGKQPAQNAPTQCCWPGQLWSAERSVCLGSPSACPAGTLVQGENCVTADADGDGILLPADLCPAQKEDLDGVDDGDGCPEDAPRTGPAASASPPPAQSANATPGRSSPPPSASAGSSHGTAIGLTIGGVLGLAVLGGMIGLREAQVANVKAGLPSPAEVVSAIELANLATGVAVGAGVVSLGLLGTGIGLFATSGRPTAPTTVGLRFVPGGFQVEGRY